jgi:hypothetical protein
MAPHAEILVAGDGLPVERTDCNKTPSSTALAIEEVDDYLFTFNNQDGYTEVELGDDDEYTIGEHIMWAPRKIRVGCIGAGAAGLMFCYKKEKEFGDDLDLVVYESEQHLYFFSFLPTPS